MCLRRGDSVHCDAFVLDGSTASYYLLTVLRLMFKCSANVHPCGYRFAHDLLLNDPVFEPEVLQIGFGAIFFWGSGEFEDNCRRILMTIFFREFFDLVFP